jgi:hypothetical protein
MLGAADETFLVSAPTRFVDTIEIALPAVMPCQHSFDLKREYGRGFALPARCAR